MNKTYDIIVQINDITEELDDVSLDELKARLHMCELVNLDLSQSIAHVLVIDKISSDIKPGELVVKELEEDLAYLATFRKLITENNLTLINNIGTATVFSDYDVTRLNWIEDLAIRGHFITMLDGILEELDKLDDTDVKYFDTSDVFIDLYLVIIRAYHK